MPSSRSRRSRPAKIHAMCLRSEGAQDMEVRALREEVRELRELLEQRNELLRQRADEIVRLQEVVARNHGPEVPPVVVVAADEDGESEGEDEEPARLVQLTDFDENDIRVRYADRYEEWFEMQAVLYHDHEIRSDNELDRFWPWLVASCPALGVLPAYDFVSRSPASSEASSELVGQEPPFENYGSEGFVLGSPFQSCGDVRGDGEMFEEGHVPDERFYEDQEFEDQQVEGVEADSSTRGQKRAHDDDDEREDENDARKRFRC